MPNFVSSKWSRPHLDIRQATRIGLLLLILLISVRSGIHYRSIQAKHTAPEAATIYHPLLEIQSADKFGFYTESNVYIYNKSGNTANVIATFYTIPAFDTIGGQEEFVYVDTIPPSAAIVLDFALLAPDLSDGLYSVKIASDEEVSSVVRTQDSSKTKLTLSQGLPGSASSPTLSFGPFQQAEGQSSGSYLRFTQIYLHQTGTGTATITAKAIAADGTILDTINDTISERDTATIDMGSFDVPADFTGWVQVESDQPLVGVMGSGSNSPFSQNDLYPPIGFTAPQQIVGASTNRSATTAFIPRVYNAVSEGNGLRNTKIFVGNLSSQASTVVATGYELNSSNVYNGVAISVPANGFSFLNVDEFISLSEPFEGSVVLSSDAPMAVAELTGSDDGTAMASYGSEQNLSNVTAQQNRSDALFFNLSMPYIGHGTDRYSILSIQNPVSSSEASVAVTFFNLDGSIQSQQDIATIPVNGSIAIDTRDQAALANGFIGSVVISSNNSVKAYIDEYIITENSPTPTPMATVDAMPTATITPTPDGLPTPTVTVVPTAAPTSEVPQTAILPPTIQVQTDTGSALVDTDTGEVIVDITDESPSQITIQRVATCADESVPDDVEIVAEWGTTTTRYQMSVLFFGLYEATIPAFDIISNSDLSVEVTCNSQVRSARIGGIQFSGSAIPRPVYLPIIQSSDQ